MSDRPRLLWVSDGCAPLTSTGFGQVTKALLPAFVDRYEVYHLALGAVDDDRIAAKAADLPAGLAGVLGTTPQDYAGAAPQGAVYTAVKALRPDCLFTVADPGQVWNHVSRMLDACWLEKAAPRPAVVAYTPIEGEPMMIAWQRLMRDRMHQPDQPDMTLDGVVSVSRYGAELVERQCDRRIPWAWHGVDHGYFRPPTDQERLDARAALGWSDKFMLMDVATNVARKQHPRLLLAFKHALKLVPNAGLYDHTKPFNGFFLGGHNLIEIAHQMGLPKDRLWFSEGAANGNHYWPGESATALDFRAYYWAADLFVHLSEVEGFGLPLAEAMACGLPVLTVPYAAGWETCGGAALGVDVADWDYNTSGTRVARADVRDVARKVAKLAGNARLRGEMRAKGIEVAARYTWDRCIEACLAETERAIRHRAGKAAA